jgi:hypothetical protein
MDCGNLALDELKILTKEEQLEPETTCTSNDTMEKRKLYLALELSQKEWKLGQRGTWAGAMTAECAWAGRILVA